ncbi:hypothetical protein GW17_00034703 [Ensete ventricosum]|nr:hypothetical protein GW17_00034703 [Ensete ventricosum]
MRNRSVMIDFDCHRLISNSLSRGREKKEDEEEEKERSQLREGERRERRRGELDFFSRHAIRCLVSYIMRSIAHGQFLLPAWVEETSPSVGRMNEATSPVGRPPLGSIYPTTWVASQLSNASPCQELHRYMMEKDFRQVYHSHTRIFNMVRKITVLISDCGETIVVGI